MARSKPFEPDMEHLHCSQCGTRNQIQPDPKGGPALRPCSKCGSPIAGMLDVLVDLGLYGMEYRPCPNCRHKITNTPYCWVCGKKLG